MFNQLKLTFIPFAYTIDNQDYTTTIGEFLIDEKPLCEWFGDGRNLGNCYTEIDIDKVRYVHFANQLTGQTEPSNQLDTPRLVLYRCHCGCDYCGVVSTEIVVQENTVTWQNVGYEDDDNMSESEMDECDKWQLTRLNFTFDKQAYIAEINRFAKENYSNEA